MLSSSCRLKETIVGSTSQGGRLGYGSRAGAVSAPPWACSSSPPFYCPVLPSSGYPMLTSKPLVASRQQNSLLGAITMCPYCHGPALTSTGLSIKGAPATLPQKCVMALFVTVKPVALAEHQQMNPTESGPKLPTSNVKSPNGQNDTTASHSGRGEFQRPLTPRSFWEPLLLALCP